MKNLIKILLLGLLFIIATNAETNAQVRKKLAAATEVEGSETFNWTYPVWDGNLQYITFACDIETMAAGTEFAGALKIFGSWDNVIWYTTALANTSYTMTAATNETWEHVTIDGNYFPYLKFQVVAESSAQTVEVTPWVFGIKK